MKPVRNDTSKALVSGDATSASRKSMPAPLHGCSARSPMGMIHVQVLSYLLGTGQLYCFVERCEGRALVF